MVDEAQHPNWSRIAKLHPQLREHVQFYPQDYRGERWYVLSDLSSRRQLRFNSAAYAFIARLDGELDVDTAWRRAVAAQGEAALDQDEAIDILTQLFAVDVLRSGLPAEATRFFERFAHEQNVRSKNLLRNPLAIRIPLFNPNRFLEVTLPWLRPLFSRPAALLWLGVVSFAAVLALLNFAALSGASQRVLAPENLLLLLLSFVVIKAIHEFAHAYAVKMWGGDVTEMGLTVLVLAPVPYVDASSAWLFRDKHKRMLVGAAGMVAELLVAALALFVWLLVEPGMVRETAFNVLLIGGVSTLLFNSNPLIRFDGYYILQDWLEIPNLATRANRYYLYLIQRYGFGLTGQYPPVTAPGEQHWFVLYGLLSFFYRLFILVLIILFLAEHYLILGVALGAWAFMTQVVLPLGKAGVFLVKSPKLVSQRPRALLITSAIAGMLLVFLCLVPLPLRTQVEGVVWVSDQAQVYAETEGFVEEVLFASGSTVKPGEVIARLRSPVLSKNLVKLTARQRELQLKSVGLEALQRVQSNMIKDELAALEAELLVLRQQEAALVIRSKVAGQLVWPDQEGLKGCHFEQGQLLAYVISPASLMVRALVPQSRIGLVKQGIKKVEVRLSERLHEAIPVSILRSTSGGSTVLPSRALGAAGGGAIAVLRDDASGKTAAEHVFSVDLGLPSDRPLRGIGERVYVRFDHGAEPLAYQWFRLGRQLLLSRLLF